MQVGKLCGRDSKQIVARHVKSALSNARAEGHVLTKRGEVSVCEWVVVVTTVVTIVYRKRHSGSFSEKR